MVRTATFLLAMVVVLSSCTSSSSSVTSTDPGAVTTTQSEQPYVHDGVDVVQYARAEARADSLRGVEAQDVYADILRWVRIAEIGVVEVEQGGDAGDICVGTMNVLIDAVVAVGDDPEMNVIVILVFIEAWVKGARVVVGVDSLEGQFLDYCLSIYSGVLDDAELP